MFLVGILLLALSGQLNAKTIAVSFDHARLDKVLQFVAGQVNSKTIVSSDVKNLVGIREKSIDAEKLLNKLIIEYRLARIKVNDYWYIAPQGEIKKLQDERERFELMLSKVWRIRFAKAGDLVDEIMKAHASPLSKRGSVVVDKRSNSIMARDLAHRINILDGIIHALDVPVKQVMIDARLVSIDTDAEKELGVTFTNSAESQGDVVASVAEGWSLTKLPHLSNIDVKLSALEKNGKAELISSPSLFTSSMTEASIEAGEEVPYQEVSRGGGTAVRFKKAVLGLHVTPQLLPDDKVLLSISVNQDRPSSRMIQGVPAIKTRKITTNAIVKNGETIVLGGIFESNNESGEEKIPFLGNIPLIGVLFTQKHHRENKRELLMFVTPRIKSL